MVNACFQVGTVGQTKGRCKLIYSAVPTGISKSGQEANMHPMSENSCSNSNSLKHNQMNTATQFSISCDIVWIQKSSDREFQPQSSLQRAQLFGTHHKGSSIGQDMNNAVDFRHSILSDLDKSW